MGCKNILVKGFSAESIKLRLFPYTLKDQARRWLLTLPSGSISTWNQLSEKFLNKYYPASKTLNMRTQILSFAQKPNEEFHEAWERFKELNRKCPHFGITSTDQVHIFFRGLNMTTKTLVNASCGGSYKDQNAQEACLLFEKMAADTQQWAVEQPQSRSVFEISNGSPYMSAQIEKMEKKLERFDAKFDMLLQRIPGSQVAVQQPLPAACSICNVTTHDFLSCPHKDAYPEFAAEQVNAFNNFQRPRYDPYSNVYNPGWRDHPNFKWDRDQPARPQFQQQVQQTAAPKAAWEVAIEKLGNATSQEFQNLQATVKNIEKQMGQIAFQVSERAPGTFPSQTKHNPRGGADCKAVRVLRSGKSYDNRGEICVGNSQAASQPQTDLGNFAESDIVTDSTKSMGISENSAKIAPETAERVYVPPMPYPERLKPKVKDQQLTDFMKTFAKVHINLPLIDAIKNIPSYAKFLKDVCTKKKKLADFEKRLGQGEIKPTSVILQLADYSVAYPKGIIEDLIIKVDNLYLPADFVVLDMDEDMQTPIILGHPFMATARTLIDVEAGTLTLGVQDQSVVFSLFEITKRPTDVQDCMRVDMLDSLMHAEIMPRLTSDPLLKVLHGLENKNTEDEEQRKEISGEISSGGAVAKMSESEEASEYVCSEDESSQTEGLVEGLIEARMVVHEGEMAGPSVESRSEAYREMQKKYKVLEASVDRVLALAHTPEVGSSNQTSPSGSVGIAVASASEGVDIRVGVSLAKRNTLTEAKLVEFRTDYSVPPYVGLRLPSAADIVRYPPEGSRICTSMASD
ncbi:unnamed protein product [Prunus armeniaca]